MRRSAISMFATASLAPALLAIAPARAEVPSPARPVTDPHAIVSPTNDAARPVPLDDLIWTRGLIAAAWSADGRQLFFSTNFTGRYNVWRVDAAGRLAGAIDAVG